MKITPIRLVLALLVTAWLFWHPVTRTIILWILPLGTGFDDLIVIASVLLAVIVAFVNGWTRIPSWLNRLFNNKRR